LGGKRQKKNKVVGKGKRINWVALEVAFGAERWAAHPDIAEETRGKMPVYFEDNLRAKSPELLLRTTTDFFSSKESSSNLKPTIRTQSNSKSVGVAECLCVLTVSRSRAIHIRHGA
jgi:hypothetical protein